MLNWNSDKVVIVHYPAGAGGNFLHNALALSKNAVPQNSSFAGLTHEEKIKRILESANESDFHTGIIEMFGCYIYSIPNYKLKMLEFSKELTDITFSNNYWFVNSHTDLQLEKCKYLFPNCKILSFYNYEDFCKSRGYDYKDNIYYYKEYTQRAGADWKDVEFSAMPKFQQQEIETRFPELLLLCKNKEKLLKDIPGDFFFDTNCYFNKEHTVNAVKKLYTELKLDDFDEKLVIQLYITWQERLNNDRIKSWHI